MNMTANNEVLIILWHGGFLRLAAVNMSVLFFTFFRLTILYAFIVYSNFYFSHSKRTSANHLKKFSGGIVGRNDCQISTIQNFPALGFIDSTM